MSTIVERFPRLREAALEIAYDNGMINRGKAEADWLAELDPVLGADGVAEEDLGRLEAWLQTLNQGDLLILCAGEMEDMAKVAEGCPRGGPDDGPLCDILNDIFEN